MIDGRLAAALLALALALLAPGPARAQPMDAPEFDDDLDLGGDIFSDFNDDLVMTQIQEDERFWSHGRFFSMHVGTGVTTFDGNRGLLYREDPPEFRLGFYYFSDFRTAYGLGVHHSEHRFVIEEPVFAYAQDPLGRVEVTMLGAWFGYRHYVDTTDLGSALTYSNPHFTFRLEYWHLTNKFVDQAAFPNDTGGGMGFSAGFGLEFPVKIKESYFNLEFLVHAVNFHDKDTRDYAPTAADPGGYGFADLSGRAYSTSVNYVMNWGP